MDKGFWIKLQEKNFEIPADHTLAELTREIFSFLGDTDPELRDEIAYITYANWLKQERYSTEDVRAHIQELLTNLEKGIGETESDSVFLRAFSVLFLAEIVHNDNKRGFLEDSDIQTIYKKGTAYITAEKDPRGFIPGKGWAHALAHSADLMMVLAKNPHLAEVDLILILYAISEKIFRSTGHLYIHGEDERLAAAVTQVLRHDLVGTKDIKQWALTFVDQNWKDAYTDEGKSRAFHNTRNLLRSIYIEIKNNEGEDPTPKWKAVEAIIFEVLNGLKPY
jgi:hypothetical protein